ncbi:MAG: pirin family protein [Acidimicrobiales bacterium]
MSELVHQTVPLGDQWPTVDPFLFCAHHRDAYPPGNATLGPAASLAGRELGQDFANVDGWNMYHGRGVPGFPAHPHRGFETVTYVRSGVIDHSDSLGARARFGRGDTQWLTAGKGIVHCEMFPLLDQDRPNPLELFQIWLNLPARNKMVEPHFTMLWDHQTPRAERRDDHGRLTTVTVITGAFEEVDSPPTPPDSWASAADSDVAIWHLVLEPEAHFVLGPASGPSTQRVLYLFEGEELALRGDGDDHGTLIGGSTGAVLDASQHATLVAGPSGAEVMVLQGRPIGEPVARYGPFVMNTDTEIQQAFADYRQTQFGGWPWPSDDPDHGPQWRRFAEHPDGRVERIQATKTAG